jgi:hypothetical protein
VDLQTLISTFPHGDSDQIQANTAAHRTQHCLGWYRELLSLHKQGVIWGISGKIGTNRQS